MRLAGKTAIIIGGSRGIGRAMSERFAEEGAKVVVGYSQNKTAADETVIGIQEANGEAMAVRANLDSLADIRHLYDKTAQAYGKPDIVVVNAATVLIKPAIDVTEQEFDKLFAINAKGVFFAMQEAAKYLQDNGRLLVTSSAGTKMLFPGNSVYLGSKGAVEQFVRTFAQELASRGITVNSILPGFTDTDMLPERDRKMADQASPFGRIGSPKDIADAAILLASEEARWITGQELGVTGGLY